MSTLTFQEYASKVDTHVSVPRRVRLGVDDLRYALRLNLVDTGENAIASPEADDDLRDA